MDTTKQNAERQRGRVRFFECGRLLFFHNLLFFVDCFLVGACFPSVERGPVGRDAKSEPFCPFPAVCRLLVPACRRAGKDSQPIALRKNVRFFPCGLSFPGVPAVYSFNARRLPRVTGTACRRPLRPESGRKIRSSRNSVGQNGLRRFLTRAARGIPERMAVAAGFPISVESALRPGAFAFGASVQIQSAYPRERSQAPPPRAAPSGRRCARNARRIGGQLPLLYVSASFRLGWPRRSETFRNGCHWLLGREGFERRRVRRPARRIPITACGVWAGNPSGASLRTGFPCGRAV